MAEEIVLPAQHENASAAQVFSPPPDISTNIGLALVEISYFACRAR
jgi:hypothetical protein